MKSWVCYGAAVVFGLFGLVVVPESVREARRISRLGSDEGLRISAEITRIEEESVSTDEGSVDRARYGPSKIEERATVRYVIAGKEYEARHRLPEPIRRHKPGDTLAIVALPDEPERSYATYEITGSWIMSFMLPGILLAVAASFGGVGQLLRRTTEPSRPMSRR